MRKILVAESSAPMRKALELALERHGLQVVSAGDGTQAAAMLSTERPDAVVVEQGLSGCSGLDICTAVRQQPDMRDVPVVLLLGAFESVDQELVAGAGIDDVWTKPFDLRRIATRLRDLAARRSASGTDAYLERLSAALAERERRPAAAPPVVARGDDESDPAVPTLASILGETAAEPTETPPPLGPSIK